MVDLLERRHRDGRRFEPLEYVERGPRVAVGLKLSDLRWDGETVEVFKVFSFCETDGKAVLLEDCVDRDDALARLDVC